MTTLYERLGGENKIATVVEIFYSKVFADERINFFFDGVDKIKLANHQKSFLIFAFGGPGNYSGDFNHAHKRLVDQYGLNGSHFDIVIDHIQSSLRAVGVCDQDIHQVTALLETTRDKFLGIS